VESEHAEKSVKNKQTAAEANSVLASQSEFDLLYDTYKSAVFSYACYLTRNEKEAEDLFQETWLRIVKNPPRSRDVSELKSWVFTITTNLYRDLLRKKRVRRTFLLEKSATSDLGPGFFAVDTRQGKIKTSRETDRVDAGNAIALALAQLPEKLHRVFVLKEIEGFKYMEISRILNLPVGTVKSMMHRAVRRLQQELAVFCPE
jgi:RNA polymerase sigma-70 factor (ECF subfamily)